MIISEMNDLSGNSSEKAEAYEDIAMSFTIICIGQPENPVQGTYTSAGFDAAVHAELGSAVLPYNGRRYNPDGKQIWLGEGMPAQDTANKILLPCSPVVDPLLNEIPLRSFTDTDKQYPAETWKRKAAAQRKHADPRQIESRQDVIERAEKVIEKVGSTEAIVITYPLFLEELLNRLRIHSFVVQRTGIMKIQPLERFLVSRREEHCGGCQHNCFLANPGCGVGRDKALRLQRKE